MLPYDVKCIKMKLACSKLVGRVELVNLIFISNKASFPVFFEAFSGATLQILNSRDRIFKGDLNVNHP